MEQARTFAVLGIIAFLLITPLSIESIPEENPMTLKSASIFTGATLVAHDGIYINSNETFEYFATLEGWMGNGSSSNPYIIQDYLINTTSTGIHISGTSVHFIIRNCLLTGLSHWGIRLYGVTNAIVENCTVFGKGGSGFQFEYLSNSSIHDCIAYSCQTGIYIRYSEDVGIDNSSISDCTYTGITAYSCSNVSLDRGNIENALIYGILGYSCNDSRMSDFVITSTYYGIRIQDAEFQIHNISITDSIYYGMRVSTGNCSIFNNSIAYSGLYGMYFDGSENCVIANNTISSSGKVDLYLSSSSNLTVEDNNLLAYGLRISGTNLEYWLHNVTGNMVRGKQIGYFLNETDKEINGNDYSQVFIINCDNVSLESGDYYNLSSGPVLSFSKNCHFSNLKVNESWYGIYVYCSENCTFEDNEISSGGILILGAEIAEWIHHFTGNLVNSKPIGVYSGQVGGTIDVSSFGQVIVSNCSNMLFDGIWANDTSTGLSIGFSNSCIIQDSIANHTSYAGFYIRNCQDMFLQNCTAQLSLGNGIRVSVSSNCSIVKSSSTDHAYDGFDIFDSDDCRIIDSNASYCANGIHFEISENGTVFNALLKFNDYGIYSSNSYYMHINSSKSLNSTTSGVYAENANQSTLGDCIFSYNSHDGGFLNSDNITIIGCIFTYNNDDGLEIGGGHNYTIITNQFTNNGDNGIYINYLSHDSLIYNNTFSDNIDDNAWCASSTNHWDDGISLGNWWDDMIEVGPYRIYPAGGYDHYPRGPMFIEDKPNAYYSIPVIGQSISFTAYSSNPDSYVVYFDEEEIDSGPWDGTDVPVSIPDGIGVGEYNLTLRLNDTAGNIVSDYVLVTVTDYAPSIEHHADVTIWLYSEVDLLWSTYDSNPSKYVIYRNSTEVASGVWFGSEVSIQIDTQYPGVYNYTLFVNDTSGQSTIDTCYVNIWNASDYHNSPPDIEYIIGTAGNHIFWNVTGITPFWYEVYRNSDLIIEYGWEGHGANISIDELDIGEYNYTIVWYSGFQPDSILFLDTVIVTVIDVAPEINSPEDLIYTFGESGNNITWQTTDTNPARYELYRNGSLIKSGDWNSSLLSFDVDGLDVGVYNFTLVIFDTSEYSAWDTIMVSVLESITTSTTTTITSTNDTTTSTNQELPDIMQIISITITFASIVVILVVVVLIARRKS